MFWECAVTKRFWTEFDVYCHANDLYETALTLENVFLGVEDNTVCTLIFVAKTFIYNKRIHDEHFTFDMFKLFASKFKNVEFYIAKANNTVDEWTEKWKFLPN